MAEIELFYSAHSAYAYIGMPELLRISRASGARIVHRPVDLGPVVAAANPTPFAQRSAAHRKYFFAREIERWAEYRGVAVKGGVPANHRNPVELPNTMLIACAETGGRVDDLSLALMRAHWADHADLADPDTLTALAEGVGVDPAPLFEAAASPEIKAIYSANIDEAIERSVFGSPTFFVDGDMFYGQDRLALVERALTRPFARNWS